MFSVPSLVAQKRSMALRGAKARSPLKRAPLRYPAVESLEDRRLLAVMTWSGGAGTSDTNWTSPANWEGGVAPTAGDDLVFSAAAPQGGTFNNFSAGTNFASISIDGSGYLLAGNAVALDNGLSVNGGDATVSLSLKLNADQSIRNSAYYGTLTLGAVDLNGYQLSLQNEGTAIFVGGQISGDGGLIIGGWGYYGVTLAVANTYTGATQVDTGYLHLLDALALGTTDGTAATGTVLRNGARLYLDGSLVVQDEFLTVDSYGHLLSSDTGEWSGDIDLSGFMSLSYESTFLLSGNTTGSAYSSLSLGGSGLLTLSGNNSIPNGQVSAYGSLQVDGSLTGLAYLNVQYGNLQGTGDVQATNVWVYHGTFQMSGMLDTQQLYVQDGILDPAGSTAIATTDTGNLYFYNTVLSVQLQSDVDYDQVNVTGTVDLGGGKLQLHLDYSPNIGQQFTIINNDGLDPVQGTLEYAEGSLILVGADAFRISYVGGTGNDVTLTRVAVTIWSGEAGAGDTNWSTAANWLGGLAPTAGYFLVFPDLTTQTIATNDYIPGTNFGGISIRGNDCVLAGNSLVLNGSLENQGANNTLDLQIVLGDSLSLVNSGGDLKTSAIDLNGHSLTFGAYSYFGVISVDGEISGAGDVIKTGYGLTILAAANTYSGTTQVNAGRLEVRNAQALGATNGTAESGTTVRGGGVLTLSGPFTFDNEMLVVGENGGTIENVGSNVWTGDVHFGSLAQLQGYGDSLLIAGNLTSESYAQIEVGGIGLLELTGHSALSVAQFSVSSGVLQIDSVLTGVNYLFINYGGTLQGAGTIQVSSYVQAYGGSIEFSGTLDAPQLYVQSGTVDPAGISATSILNSGSLSLWNGTLRMQLAGDADYDQVDVTGTVDLAYATLELAVGYTPTIGQRFTLINNDDTDAVAGIFNNQPEGSLIATDNMAFRISYVGGDGNDVVLTRVAAGFWSGGAGEKDMRWRTAANWAGGLVPSTGEPLFFPSNAAQRSTVNNFPAGTIFSSINILGAGYTLAGNRVTLQAGMIDSGGDCTVTLPITLAAPQSIVSYSGVLTVGAINQNGHQLTLDAAGGALIANGQISGAGGLITTGYGEVTLTSSNTYSGTTTVNGGTLRIQNAKSLGSANGKSATGTTLNGGGGDH